MNFKRFREIQAENAALCERKNAAYGDRNLTRFGAFGVMVRMMDKMERLINLVRPVGIERAGDEAAKDTARDMANYATILQMFLEGRFDDEEEVKDGQTRSGKRGRGRMGRRGSRRSRRA